MLQISHKFTRQLSSHFSTFTKTYRYSQDQLELKQMVADFAQRELSPFTLEMDKNASMILSKNHGHSTDFNAIEKLGEYGFLGIEIPEKYGGLGLSFSDTLIVIEEISKIDASVGVLVDIHNTLINRIISDETLTSIDIREKWLPRLSSEMVGSFAISEPSSGSDAFSLKCRATTDDHEHYILNGTKSWISNSREAGVFIVFATIDQSLGYKGITAFLVPRDSEGLEIGNPETKMGIKASSTCSLFLSNVRVPKSHVIGKVGEGYKIAINTLNEGRIGIASQMLGIAKGAWELGIDYTLNTREQFKTKIFDFQLMRADISKIAIEIECAESLIFEAGVLRDEYISSLSDGSDINRQMGLRDNLTMKAAMAKIKASEVAEIASSRAIEWLGGVGYTSEYKVEKFYRDSKIGSIYEGTTNIQLDTIGKIIRKRYLK